MISVYVVDTRELIRRGLRDAIAETSDMQVVGDAPTPAAALLEVGRLDPDVIVIDFDGGQPEVLQFCRVVSAEPNPTPVLVSLRRPNRARISEAALAGAAGHLIVTCRTDEIVDRIRDAHHAPPALGTDLVGDSPRTGTHSRI